MKMQKLLITKSAFAASLLVGSGWSLANSGVQLPLGQYQAGTEQTNSSLITNSNFEQVDANNFPVGWTPDTAEAGTLMTAGAPDPANLPNPSSVLGTRVGRLFGASGIDAFDNYKITQNVALAPNTDYVLSAYVWNYGFAGPPPHTDLTTGDLAGVELEPTVPGGPTAGFFVEPISVNGVTSSAGGYFIYKSFNSSQFAASAGVARLEIEFDPNQNIQPFTLRPNRSAQWDNIALTPLTQFSSQVFNNPAGGSYDSVGNWVNGPVNALTAIATFKANTVGAPAVTINTAKKMAVITFDATGGYTLNGAGTIVLDHEESRDAVILNNLQSSSTINNTILVNGGTTLGGTTLVARNLQVNVANANGILTVANIAPGTVGTFATGTFNVIKTGAGRFDPAGIRAQALRIDQGEVRMRPGSPASRVGTFTIAGDAVPTARLSLTNNALVVDYAAAGGSPLATIKAQIIAGYAGGAMTGNGIVSGQGAQYAVGYAEASQLSLVPAIFGTVDASAVLLRGTIAGDANLDGSVNLDDFTALAASFGSAGEWINGNFNYSSSIDLDDFTILAANFGSSVAADVPRGTIVPEPTTLGLLGVATSGLLRRHRHRRGR